MKDLGKKIALRRKSVGLSQEELADYANINLRTVQRIESGVSEPHGNTLRSLCKVLELTIEDIYDYSKSENPQYLVMLYLSALVFIVVPMGNVILPLILWISNRNRIIGVNQHGREILNFQLTWTIILYLPIVFHFLTMFTSLDLGFLIHFGFKSILLFVLTLSIINIIFIVVGAILARHGRMILPLSIPFIRK